MAATNTAAAGMVADAKVTAATMTVTADVTQPKMLQPAMRGAGARSATA